MDIQPSSKRPSLVVSPSQFDAIATAVKNNSDTLLCDLYSQLKIAAHNWSGYNNDHGIVFGTRGKDNLLTPARHLVNVAYLYAGLSQVELLLDNTCEAEYFAEIAISQAVAASNLPSWLWPAPSALLSLGEMSHGVAVIYDWCYSFLSDDDKNLLESALASKGLGEYQRQIELSAYWWTGNPRSNFTNVINSGIGTAAIALSDRGVLTEEELSSILDSVNSSLVLAMSMYAPDGGWPEGLTYWAYATRYTCYYLSTLANAQPANQATMSLLSSPGFSETGLFSIHSTAPPSSATAVEEVFNFSDCGPIVGDRHFLFWMDEHYDKHVYSYYEREFFVKSLVSDLRYRNAPGYAGTNGVTSLVEAYSPKALNLLWYSDRGASSDYDALPLGRSFKGINVAYYRASWTDKNAIYVGLKGGNNSSAHSHLDLGSFILNWAGVRWLIDLGKGDYTTKNYFQTYCGGARWAIENVSTRYHNVWRPILPSERLTDPSSGLNQNPTAAAPITSFDADADRTAFTSVVSLSNAYPLQGFTNAARRFSFGRNVFTVSDRISTGDSFEFAIAWSFMTEATVTIEDDTTLVLSQDGHKLQIEIVGPGVSWKGWQEVTDSDPGKMRVQAASSQLWPNSTQTTKFNFTLIS